MVHEATSPQYSAVICRHCHEPIPVPGIVLRIETLSFASNADAEQSDRAFTLRCRACEGEYPYRSSQIVQVQGHPKGRRTAASTIYRHGMARAAGA